jgi:RimJ/RimL family protein N-acetyltransferase
LHTNVSLQPMDLRDAQALWLAGQSDDAWPALYADEARFMALVEQQHLAETLGQGLIRKISAGAECAGYILMNEVPPHLLPEGGTAVECGTYLLPEFRGKRLNEPVKAALVSLAKEVFAAEWCLFVIPRSNRRAQAAMEKLPWSVQRHTAEDFGPFRTFLRRRVWETGSDSLLYAVRVEDVLRLTEVRRPNSP